MSAPESSLTNNRLRCDRALPACGNCVNRADITACCYVPRESAPGTKSQDVSSLSDNAQGRIDHLERLVLTLLKGQKESQAQVATPASSEATNNVGHYDPAGHNDTDQEKDEGLDNIHEEPTTSFVRPNSAIKINADYKQSLSVDEAHWSLLLNEIRDVRSYLRAQDKQYQEKVRRMSQALRRADGPGPTLLFGSTMNLSLSEILSQLPSRYFCDNLVARYWTHMYPALCFLHAPTFQKQYERFWQDQNQTSIIWIALLFAILRIAALDYVREGDEPIEYGGKCQDLATTFRNRLTDCLILGDYTQPHECLIEVMCLHLYAEYASSRDAKSSVWVLIGLIVRLAMRMGYHQPSQPTLSSTPFKCEMRRRVWAFIRQSDIILSFQMGLPSMIRSRLMVYSNLPRNFHDDESFHEDCTKLPTTLPDLEPTQVSALVAKTKLAFGFARAVEEISSTEKIRWERILEIDRELRQIYDNIPHHYKLGQLSDQDSLVLISFRFTLSSIHHKSLCVLHSRFLARPNGKYLYSRRACLSSAMSILRFQAIQNQEIPTDGRSRSLTTYQTSLTIHDYLLAATIISADLCSNASALGHATSQQASQGMPTRAEMVKALGVSAHIFSQMRDRSLEADKAADVLEMLVKKLAAGNDPVAAHDPRDLSPLLRNWPPSWSQSNNSHITNPLHHQPPPPQTFSTTSSTIEVAATNPDATSSYQQNQQSLHHTDASTLGRPGQTTRFLNLDAFSARAETVQPPPSFLQTFPDLETSAGWVGPECSDLPM
ncbi:hypothetical protein MMC13_000824, partial [Lambiella insularis]|nr:hypothetical protein [Lambiella insularis]